MSNTVDALKPEFWSQAMQVPLYKSLVAKEIATTRLESDLKQGDTVNDNEPCINLAKCWKLLRALGTIKVKLLGIGQSAGQESIL